MMLDNSMPRSKSCKAVTVRENKSCKIIYAPKALGFSVLVVGYHVDKHLVYWASERNDLKVFYLKTVI